MPIFIDIYLKKLFHYKLLLSGKTPKGMNILPEAP